jgi:hypothetical protein
MKGITFQEMGYAIDKMAKSIQSLNVSVTGLSNASSIAVKRIEQRAKIKKRFFIGLFLMCGFVHAQDYAVISQLKSTNFDNSLKIANDMRAMAKNNYHLFKYKEFEHERVLKIVYAPEGTTDEQLNISMDYSNCLVVEYKIYFEGENKDLEKQGIKKYTFNKLQGKYLDLFPIWQNWFNPSADIEKTLSDSNSREFRDYEKNIQFYIQKQGNIWTLRNDS